MVRRKVRRQSSEDRYGADEALQQTLRHSSAKHMLVSSRVHRFVSILAVRRPLRFQAVTAPAHRLHSALRHDERVLDAHSDGAIGKEKSRLDRDDVAGFNEIAARRLLVNIESDAVTQSMYVALERLWIVARVRIAAQVEEVADHVVIADEARAGTHGVAGALERDDDVRVNACELVGDVADAKRARHVEEVAGLAIDGEDVENDRRRRLDVFPVDRE